MKPMNVCESQVHIDTERYGEKAEREREGEKKKEK